MSNNNLFFQAILAFILLPGIFAFFLPLIISYFDPWNHPFFLPGSLVVVLGIILLLWCIRDFYVSGKGTLAPWRPPQNLVIIGPYHFIRNPMYMSVFLLVLGWGIFFYSPILILYDFMLFIIFHIFVIKFEEPWLHEQFGKSWEIYRKNVPRWLPRK
jgi:protein-S-isoprenylcysteine O-methyltransferase Ste14